MRSLSADSHSKSSKGASIWSLSQSPTPRMRVSGMHSQTTYDQVYGCNKDFNSSKDHQERNKVFEAHTTDKVIAKGIKQKFCRQCSRFHLPAEVDDGKHRCCKLLAGRAWRFQLYNGIRFQGTSSGASQNTSTATSLPMEIIVGRILPRLSTKELSRLQLVSRDFHLDNVREHSVFLREKRRHTRKNLIFSWWMTTRPTLYLPFMQHFFSVDVDADADGDGAQHATRLRHFVLPNIEPIVFYDAQGVEGLVLFCRRYHHTLDDQDLSVFCPATHQYREIPSAPLNNLYHELTQCSFYYFCYSPMTDEYKILELEWIFYLENPISYQFRVLTLGSHQWNQWGDFVWRNLELDLEGVFFIEEWSYFKKRRGFVYHNGVLYWLLRGSILTFNVEDERFRISITLTPFRQPFEFCGGIYFMSGELAVIGLQVLFDDMKLWTLRNTDGLNHWHTRILSDEFLLLEVKQLVLLSGQHEDPIGDCFLMVDNGTSRGTFKLLYHTLRMGTFKEVDLTMPMPVPLNVHVQLGSCTSFMDSFYPRLA